MQPTATDAAWSVYLSVTTMSCAKKAEEIVMPSGVQTQVRPRNGVLGEGSDHPGERGN